MVTLKKHLEIKGLQEIAKVIEEMNRKVPSRFLKSSETKSQTCQIDEEDIVRTL